MEEGRRVRGRAGEEDEMEEGRGRVVRAGTTLEVEEEESFLDYLLGNETGGGGGMEMVVEGMEGFRLSYPREEGGMEVDQ